MINSSQSDLELPKFFELDLKNKISFDTINKHIDNDGSNWNMLVPVAKTRNRTGKDVSVLKSLMNRKLNVYLLGFTDWKLSFQVRDVKGVDVIDAKKEFESILREIY